MSDNFFQYLFKNQQDWSMSSGKLNQSQFATKCKQKQSNMSLYLQGSSLGNRLMPKVAKNLFALQINPVIEMGDVPTSMAKWNEIPEKSGICVFYDSGGNVAYIGKSKQLRTEVQNALSR